MKQAKQRVVAIDYFRGFCLLLVVINHAIIFSTPFAIWTGAGGLWTSAAEMFLLLSGITFAIVRGDAVKTEFKSVLRKTWRRAAIIYSVNIVVVLTSFLMALVLSGHGLTDYTNGAISDQGPLSLLLGILTLRYRIGWADFLMYYSVFLIAAPFLLYAMKTRLWPGILALSMALFTANYLNLLPNDIYSSFALWQVYFVLGLVIGRFRRRLLEAVTSLPKRTLKAAAYSVVSACALVLALSYLLEHSVYNAVSRLAAEGWLPVKAQAAYLHLLSLRPHLDTVFLDGRAGILRPLVTVLVAGAAYAVYRKYGKALLARTGDLFIGFGRDSMWLFVAQALLIPLFAALPVAHGPILNNFVLTAGLVFSIWLINKRRVIFARANNYAAELKSAFYEAKYSALYGQRDDA